MNRDKLNILIGGPAGAGIEKAGKMLTTALVRVGWHVFANVEHMSQIRGGNNFLRIRVSKEEVSCHVEEIDIMIALDEVTVDEHEGEMREGGVILNEESCGMRAVAAELGNVLAANTVALGVVCGLTGFDAGILKGVLKEVFAGKSAEVVALNEKAVDRGVEIGEGMEFGVKLDVLSDAGRSGRSGRMFLMGNDALCLGAVKAGCKFVGEYPMTPSSSILHVMAKWAGRYGIVVKHTEDEISALGSAIGAGYAGARAMTATSGGGFALMTEMVGLAGMNEVPVVIVNVMRPGPATGQPTRTEQGDLRQVLHSGQGDPVKIVLLPGDAKECFEMGFEAFNLAEKYQLPVIICYDKYLGEGYFTCDEFEVGDLVVDRGKLVKEVKGSYKRYLLTDDGVSPRTVPGVAGGEHTATSDEHNEKGEIFEGASNRKAMVEKRMKKVHAALADVPGPCLYGEEGADVTFVTWGSCKAMCLEACGLLGEKGMTANVLQVRTAMPFRTEKVKKILGEAKRVVLVEQNYSGQMGGLIAEHTGILIEERILKYDGRPMTAEYIVSACLSGK
ncbi:MAG: 2-oxoacid:acceptor oxidoreductase subunit alpha [Candidatus Peregrinibacteria bacterium]